MSDDEMVMTAWVIGYLGYFSDRYIDDSLNFGF